MLIWAFGRSSDTCWEQQAITWGKALQSRWRPYYQQNSAHVFLVWNTCCKKIKRAPVYLSAWCLWTFLDEYCIKHQSSLVKSWFYWWWRLESLCTQNQDFTLCLPRASINQPLNLCMYKTKLYNLYPLKYTQSKL